MASKRISSSARPTSPPLHQRPVPPRPAPRAAPARAAFAALELPLAADLVGAGRKVSSAGPAGLEQFNRLGGRSGSSSDHHLAGRPPAATSMGQPAAAPATSPPSLGTGPCRPPADFQQNPQGAGARFFCRFRGRFRSGRSPLSGPPVSCSNRVRGVAAGQGFGEVLGFARCLCPQCSCLEACRLRLQRQAAVVVLLIPLLWPLRPQFAPSFPGVLCCCLGAGRSSELLAALASSGRCGPAG